LKTNLTLLVGFGQFAIAVLSETLHSRSGLPEKLSVQEFELVRSYLAEPESTPTPAAKPEPKKKEAPKKK
jgi:hypothetical protein